MFGWQWCRLRAFCRGRNRCQLPGDGQYEHNMAGSIESHVNRPGSLLKIICCKHVCRTREPLQQAILESEDRSWTDNGCFGEYLPDDLLASCLYHVSAFPILGLLDALLTFVRKNSDGESLFALCEDI